MFKTLQNALKMKELRGRLIFTFLMLLVIRFGSQLPVPGVDPDISLISLMEATAMRLTCSML